MPCRYDDDGESARELHTKLNETTALLCEACNRLELAEFMPPSGSLAVWWHDHKVADAIRKAQERKRADEQRTQDLREATRLMAKHNVKKLIRK